MLTTSTGFTFSAQQPELTLGRCSPRTRNWTQYAGPYMLLSGIMSLGVKMTSSNRLKLSDRAQSLATSES